MIRPVCTAWEPEPIPRETAGVGRPSSEKKMSLIFSS
jgi:hypothetical protein